MYEDDILVHYGTKRHSGRYPWGSGDNPYQHDPNFQPQFESSNDFLERVKELKKQGLSEPEIAKATGVDGSTELRVYEAVAKHEQRANLIAQIRELKNQGLNNNQIGKRIGKNESSIRALLDEEAEARMNQAINTAKYLEDQVKKKGMVDISKGVARYLGISEEKMKEARIILEADGYEVGGVSVPQVTNKGKNTIVTVLAAPGTKYADMIKNKYDIKSVYDDGISYDNGKTFKKPFEYPSSLDPKRLAVRYAEDGGKEKDGLIELRPGVDDISLGGSNYSQVRIMVDGSHYLKGMAVYSNNLPDGVDVLFNTNKTKDTPILGPKDNTVLKVLKKDKDGNVDRDNPFGSLIKEHGGQSYYDDPNGKYVDPDTGKHQSLSLINKRADEGDWDDWSKKLPSQFLSKQPQHLINKQLNLSKAEKKAKYEEILALTNPVVKKHFLSEFADACDRTAVHLEAASLPRQTYKAILPIPSLSDTEVYAPGFEPGEKVALIRFPHGGQFEIPILTVNNKNKEAREYLSDDPKDAIGINKNVAARMSGADFDGDTVMVIPVNDKVRISNQPPLAGLVDFDPQMAYPKVEGMKIMKDTQKQMGEISNLITDMQTKGAPPDELARAVRHSMVVIDAEKHELNYKLSEKIEGIAELKKKYQAKIDPKTGKIRYGADTIISRAKSKVLVPERKEGQIITDPNTGTSRRYMFDPNTGEKLYTETGREYIKVKLPGSKKWTPAYETKDGVFYKDADGNRKQADPSWQIQRNIALTETTQMANTSDAFSLVSETDNKIERAYAEYANQMKSLANSARKELYSIENLKYNPDAKKAYSKEVAQIMSEINEAEKNAPKERAAQILAGSRIEVKKKAYPDMSDKELKKIEQQELVRARAEVGAKRKEIHVSSKQWEAIQNGAVTNTTLTKLMRYANPDELRELAMPRKDSTPSKAVITRIKSMRNSGYTAAEIARAVNYPLSTIRYYISEESE